jgi:hypothetical protein
MSDDHRALIDEARVNHRQSPSGGEWCFFCRADWPCHAIRLADALEAESARASALEQKIYDEQMEGSAICMDWSERLDAAEARGARLARVAKAAQDWETLWSGGRVTGKTLSDVCEELADSTAALATQEGEG